MYLKITMKTNIILSIVIVSTVLFTSCSNEQDEKNTNAELVKKAKIEVDTTDVFASEKYDFMLPQPFALVSSFENVNLKYDVTRMNAPENVENYNSEGKKILNFGVYITDLVFSIIHEKPQSSLNYFNTVKEMADHIGMGSIFTQESLADSIEKNIANREKMEYLLIDVHEKSQEYLESNEMRLLASIQFAGAWSEGMFLATREIPLKNREAFVTSITDQMSLARIAIEGIEEYKERDIDLEVVLGKIKSIKAKYDDFEAVKNGKGAPQLTDEDLTVLQKAFDDLRSTITQ